MTPDSSAMGDVQVRYLYLENKDTGPARGDAIDAMMSTPGRTPIPDTANGGARMEVTTARCRALTGAHRFVSERAVRGVVGAGNAAVLCTL